MNTPNNVTSGLYCEIDRFRCLQCGHDDYRHRYRCERHLVEDAYCREAIPMITPDRNVFCRDCAEDDDLEASNQGHMSPKMPVTQHVSVGSNITQGGTGSQPVSTNNSQAPGPANPNMSSEGWNEPGGVQLSTFNSQSSAHASPDQDLEIAPLVSQIPLAAPPSLENSNTTTAPPPTLEPTLTSEPTPPPTPALESSPEPSPESSSEPAAEPAIRRTGICERLRSWCCCISEEPAT
ncbi:uncharacterized protein Bfra_008356 [Botrytis fragariae]|uniref:Uncharacterized protein n=1 Tax=Botrytis fragariae TaxID=1964551 RepID=A0A8H6AT82_9HELO|nr:uncharacterized protein Bfra_008356 [Botrytis fragariae]KAF5873079.1 hypothetical protein Bfra_008356 [Botrytis fragariae]